MFDENINNNDEWGWFIDLESNTKKKIIKFEKYNLVMKKEKNLEEKNMQEKNVNKLIIFNSVCILVYIYIIFYIIIYSK